MKKYKAILFDFDGVIGKTMEDNYQAWKNAFSKHNITIDKKEYFLLEGMNTRKVAEHYLKERAKSPEIVTEVVALKEKNYLENNKFCFYDGVESLVYKLKEDGYRVGLVSGGSSSRLSRIVYREFLEKMDVIITGDKVRNCKPHPESYLNAAKHLSVDPSECIVVENAPIGIKSAKEAGMYCIAICSTLEKKHLQNADKIIDKFSDLGGVMQSFEGDRGIE